MRVRSAARDDLLPIGRLADAAIWDSYAGLLKPDTIGRVLSSEFSPSSLRRRLLRGGVLVVEEGDDLVGFADVYDSEGCEVVAVIATDPAFRLRGIGRLLLTEAIRRQPRRPLVADVLLGTIDAERFFEAVGFVPGEVVHRVVFGEDVVERRWWCEPAVKRMAAGR